jgi:hypothetical protein
VDIAMALRRIVTGWLPKRTKPVLRTKIKRKETYPKGYEVSDLGSHKYK